jgi:predicted house-cleaning noncanonical NTP pyrophosphatase (MazG superfamily)
MEKYTKLVRDKIPEILDEKGIPYQKEIATGDELKDWLVLKLEEEINEFKEAKNIEELADILEVIKALQNLPEFSDVESVRHKKSEERGGFEQGIILTGEK